MQLSDGDREAILELLRRHAAVGRLDVAELERRTEQVLRAARREDADAVLADLPALPPEPHPATTAAARGRRGHAEAAGAEPGWTPTGERFRDPRSGRVMRVWLDPAGARHYIAEGA